MEIAIKHDCEDFFPGWERLFCLDASEQIEHLIRLVRLPIKEKGREISGSGKEDAFFAGDADKGVYILDRDLQGIIFHFYGKLFVECAQELFKSVLGIRA